MRRGGILALILIALLAGRAGATNPASPDAFLDEVIKPPPESDSFLYLEQVEGLKKVAGKPLIFPSALLEFAAKAHLKLGWRMGDSSNPPLKRREYLNLTATNLGLKWVYDPKRDALVWSFPWPPAATATHTGRENVQTVLQKQPRPQPYGTKNDPETCQALRELFTAPASYPMNWQSGLLIKAGGSLLSLSGYADVSSWSYRAKMLQDSAGHSHLLLMMEVLSFTIPGPAPKYFVFLFSEDGTWEDFGSFEAGSSRMPSEVEWDPKPAVKFTSRSFLVSRYSMGFGGGDIFQWDGDTWLGWLHFSYDAADKRVAMTVTWTNATVYRWIIGVDKNRLTCTTTRDGAVVSLSDCKTAGFTELERLPK